MALNYVSVSERNFARGINQLASEDAIPEGFVEDLLNADSNPDGLIEKRTGHVGHLGGLPLRVVSADWLPGSVNNLCLTFDDAVSVNEGLDLGSVPAQPIVIYGKSSQSSMGSFGSSGYTARWYPTFSANARKTYSANTLAGTIVQTAGEHASPSANMLVQVTESLSALNKSNSLLFQGGTTQGIAIDTTTRDVTVQYGNLDPADVSVFVFVKPVPGAGTGYTHSFTSASSISIPAATHGLNSFNILVQVFEEAGGTLSMVVPDLITVNSSTGQVDITLSAAITGRVQLYTPPVGQQVVGALQGSGTTVVTLPKPELDFPFLQVYLRSGATDEWVIPDSVETDVDAENITITFQNSGAEQYVLHYDAVDVRVNKLCVTDPNTTMSLVQDTQPEFVVYGLPHAEVYEAASGDSRRDGWVHHIDSYIRVTAEQTTRTLVAGLGWNFFTEQGQDASARIPLLYPRLRARADGAVTIAPAFGYPERTRGHFAFTGAGEGWASIQSIAYNSPGRMTVTLATPGLAETGTPLRTLSANPGSQTADVLTIQGAELRALDGEWPIYSYTAGTDTLSLTVLLDDAHPDLTTGGSGLGGVFSDVLPLDSQPGFLPGDRIFAPALPDGASLRVVARIESDNDLVVAEVSEPYGLSSGQLVTGEHVGRVFGARNLDGTAIILSDTQRLTPVRTDDMRFVRGDGEGTEYPHPFEVQHVVGTSVPLASYDGTTKELTLTDPANATKFAVGQWIALDGLGRLSCECQITDITPTGELVLSAGPDGSYSLSGQSIRSGFSLPASITVRDDSFSRNYFVVDGRWLPIEQPSIDTTVHTLAKPVRTKHLTVNDYGTQPYVRSTTITNNIYLTNGQDPVLKYDGVGLHRAGFFRYQAEATLSLVTNASGAALTENKFYRYYIRYEAIDQNGNVVPLAATGSEDLLVKTDAAQKGTVYVRANNLPDIGGENFEYDRLFVSLYRTKAADTAAATGTLYLVERRTVTAAWSQPYVSFVDNYPDSALREVDAFASIPGTTEFATLTEGPLRAKHITTLSNVMVLANTSSWPRVRMQIQAQSSAAYSDLSGKKFRLRRDITSTATATDMVNVVNYEYVTSAGVAASATVSSGVATVTATGTWAAGDWVYLSATTTPNNTDVPSLRGWYMVETGGSGSFTVRDATLANGAVVDTHLRVWAASGSQKDVPIVLLSADQNWADGVAGSTLNDVVRQTSIAINASMRAVNRSVSGMEQFVPWVISNVGGDYTQGALILEQPYYAPETFSFEQVSGSEPFTATSNYRLFVEGFAVTGTTKQLALVQRYPSRIHLSKVNYPETFISNTLFSEFTDVGDSIDINAADGQEITAVIPFFGTSTGKLTNQDAKLVVFKTNSIYFVDLSGYLANGAEPAFQLIQTQGLGCGAPYSPAYVQGGIMFANEAGIYKLSMSNDMTPHGQFIERIWKGTVNKEQLTVMQGHNFATGRKYKLSVPLEAASANSDVLVYNYTAESRGQFGSWSRYDSHPSTGWCNLLGVEYFGSTSGKVYRNRASGTRFDYADAAEQPIQAVALLRTTDFGDAGVRKRLLHVTAAYRAPREANLNLSQQGTALSVAVDQREQFTSTELYQGAGRTQDSGLGDEWTVKGDTLRYSVAIPKARYFQVRVENATLYEPMELTGITYRVAGLTTLGAKEAADSGRTP